MNDFATIQFTGSNLLEVSDFLAGTHFEFTGSAFRIPSPAGDVLVQLGDWLVKDAEGTFTSVPDKEVQFVAQAMTPPKKRGGKKK